MKFIGFGQLSCYLLFPLFTPVFSSLFVTISQSFISPSNSNNTLYNHPLISTFFMFIAQILVGILELLSNRLQKHKSKIQSNQRIIKYQTVFYLESIHHTSSQNIFTLYFIMFGLIILETFALAITCCLYKMKREILISQLIAMQMVFSGLFSYLILHYKIFKHQFISLGLFIFGIGIISFKAIFEEKEGLYVLTLFFAIIMWSFQSVVAKWLMETKLMSQFKYLFIHGAMGAVFIAVILIISPYIPCSNEILCYQGENGGVFENTWNTLGWIFSTKFIINFVAMLIVTSIYNSFQLTTIKLFTPTHNDASESLGSMISWIYMAYIDNVHSSDDFILPCQVIGFVMMIIASLMYNEIIIIYVFNLNYYTRLDIAKRSEEELKISSIDISMVNFEDNIDYIEEE